ncbi:type IV toxin-antitoxin system AbiEi family antitoxin domain-containing protein [Terrabacter sp. C0L_2]|uniref:type IV toxin-antitoxin system AbiEi family antitoxin domain-containing protein n=1 Tax=Terrabacter sp. C0L_2 TaxID=3108389 RepID=UPI002ED05C19|nr:type IV toxin-antitoxin system AbiEi family antitoxin domain-containing protein [Terrabacter sp. C0L_2]
MDPLLAARIRGQSGLVTREQALAAGLTEKAIRWRVTSGRWTVVHPRVYLTEPGREGWDLRATAALLHVGRPAALFRWSAGHAWSLVHRGDDPIEVVVPIGRSGRTRDGITIVRSREFHQRLDPTAWPHRVSAAHTVFDLSAGAPLDRAVALMAKAQQLRLCTPDELRAALATRSRQPQRRLLMEALGEVGEGVESAAEHRYVRDVERAHGLPVGRRQAPAPGQRHRDSAYDAQKVVVEVDGRLGHEGWAAQAVDRRRDIDSAVTGWLTVRPTWLEVADAPCRLAADLDTILRSRGWTGRAVPCRRPGCFLARQRAG